MVSPVTVVHSDVSVRVLLSVALGMLSSSMGWSSGLLDEDIVEVET